MHNGRINVSLGRNLYSLMLMTKRCQCAYTRFYRTKQIWGSSVITN